MTCFTLYFTSGYPEPNEKHDICGSMHETNTTRIYIWMNIHCMFVFWFKKWWSCFRSDNEFVSLIIPRQLLRNFLLMWSLQYFFLWSTYCVRDYLRWHAHWYVHGCVYYTRMSSRFPKKQIPFDDAGCTTNLICQWTISNHFPSVDAICDLRRHKIGSVTSFFFNLTKQIIGFKVVPTYNTYFVDKHVSFRKLFTVSKLTENVSIIKCSASTEDISDEIFLERNKWSNRWSNLTFCAKTNFETTISRLNGNFAKKKQQSCEKKQTYMNTDKIKMHRQKHTHIHMSMKIFSHTSTYT